MNHSSIAYESIVEAGAKVIDSVILPNVVIGYNSFLKKVIVNKGVIIPECYHCDKAEITLITDDNLLEVGEICE